MQAATGGADLADLAVLAAEIAARTARPDTDNNAEERRFGSRHLFLDEHFGGHARLDGNLTPAAAAAVRAVLDSLGTRAGPEDTRSKAQRDHDALEEACRLLLAAGGLPGRAGQPVRIELQMTLSQLLSQPEADPALAARITATGTPAPPGADCDAQIIPVVTATLDPDTLTELTSRRLSPHQHATSGHRRADRPAGDTNPGSQHQSQDDSQPCTPAATASQQTLARARRAAAALTITDALRLLSGPGGMAAALRAHLTPPAATISLPLDIGTATDTIPAGIRRAITHRDTHCRFPGCHTPATACHIHHLRPRARGGQTSVSNCCLLCPFHHLIAIHRWGWHLTLNPDGTTTATSPDRTRTYHSHAPPSVA